jgi:hypothetical protein
MALRVVGSGPPIGPFVTTRGAICDHSTVCQSAWEIELMLKSGMRRAGVAVREK